MQPARSRDSLHQTLEFLSLDAWAAYQIQRMIFQNHLALRVSVRSHPQSLGYRLLGYMTVADIGEENDASIHPFSLQKRHCFVRTSKLQGNWCVYVLHRSPDKTNIFLLHRSSNGLEAAGSNLPTTNSTASRRDCSEYFGCPMNAPYSRQVVRGFLKTISE